MSEPRIVEVAATDTEHIAAVAELFEEYAEWLAPFVRATTISAELESLPRPFVRPEGGLWAAIAENGAVCGCVGLKRHSATECEVKRLFVRPECRGTGLGGALFSAALDAACEIGYTDVLVSTIPEYMPQAVAMYERLGFVPARRFEDHTHADVAIRYLRLELGAWCP